MSAELKVAKFGGTSLADAQRIRNVVDIVHSDPTRRCVVVSAPGKRDAEDTKITDLLESWVHNSKKRADIWQELYCRFATITKELKLSLDISKLFEKMRNETTQHIGLENWLFHYMRSRGEWLNAQIVAEACNFEFVDASDFIAFNPNGEFSMYKTSRRAKKLKLKEKTGRGVVVPGFYGKSTYDAVHSFNRGGSDISGAIVAALVEASVYENWTDVEGVLRADPHFVPAAKKIDAMTYAELRELTFMGANVFHPDAAAFVWKAGIPTHVRCTMTPKKTGTLVTPALEAVPGTVTGIAGKNGFSVITLEKYGVDEEVGFLYRLAGVFKKLGISVGHAPGTVDTMSVVIDSEELRKKREEIMRLLHRQCRPDNVRVLEEVVLVCTVGLGMKHVSGMAGRLMSALGRAGVNIELINQGASEINIVVGVHKADGPSAIRAAHDEFFP